MIRNAGFHCWRRRLEGAPSEIQLQSELDAAWLVVQRRGRERGVHHALPSIKGLAEGKGERIEGGVGSPQIGVVEHIEDYYGFLKKLAVRLDGKTEDFADFGINKSVPEDERDQVLGWVKSKMVSL